MGKEGPRGEDAPLAAPGHRTLRRSVERQDRERGERVGARAHRAGGRPALVHERATLLKHQG